MIYVLQIRLIGSRGLLMKCRWIVAGHRIYTQGFFEFQSTLTHSVKDKRKRENKVSECKWGVHLSCVKLFDIDIEALIQMEPRDGVMVTKKLIVKGRLSLS